MAFAAFLRPIPLLAALGAGSRQKNPWTMSWDHITRISKTAHKCLLIEANHGTTKEFRFGTEGGFRHTVAKLNELGKSLSETKGNTNL
jgi:hypothetical protein